MPFKKGHGGFGGRKKDTSNGKKKEGNNSLDTYYFSKTRFTKGQKYLDPELIDHYINNDLDLTELLDDK